MLKVFEDLNKSLEPFQWRSVIKEHFVGELGQLLPLDLVSLPFFSHTPILPVYGVPVKR